jgi:glutathione S-transferase
MRRHRRSIGGGVNPPAKEPWGAPTLGCQCYREKTMLTFFFAPGSSSMAPHIALHEVGASFESRPLSFAKREHRAPEYLALNPEGKVPTLLVEGRPLTEVAAILFYLAKRFPDAGLSGGDLEAEAHVLSWMSFVASTLHSGWIARRTSIDATRAAFGIANDRLGLREWALGERYSVADIHLFRLYWRFRKWANLGAHEFPSLSRHHDRMMTRRPVQRTLEIEAAIGYELPA